MKYLVEFKLDGGSSVYIEAEDPSESRQRVGRGDQVPEQAEQRFADALARVKPAAEAVLQTLHDLNMPTEIALEFGVKFNAKAVAIIASVDSEATFKVALKWVNKP
jgi:hypothetical protein